MTDARVVWAIDVTTSVISLARIEETDAPSVPKIGLVTPVSAATHSPYSTWHHARAAATQVLEKVTAAGTPTLVMLAKNMWGAMEKDSSAERRFRLYNAIEDELFAAQIPVTEFPYATAAKWLMGHTPRGKSPQIMKRLEDEADTLWGIKPPTTTTTGGVRRIPFRVPVTSLAAIGGVAVGISVADVEVTEARLTIMSGRETEYLRANAAIQWAKNRTPPRSVEQWEKLHRNPSKLKAA